MIIPYGLEFKKFPLIDGKYIKLEFRKEFKKFIPQFLRILFWNQKNKKIHFFSEIRKGFKKNLKLHFQNKIFNFIKFLKKKYDFFSIYQIFWKKFRILFLVFKIIVAF